jgi:hypothetical protein
MFVHKHYFKEEFSKLLIRNSNSHHLHQACNGVEKNAVTVLVAIWVAAIGV